MSRLPLVAALCLCGPALFSVASAQDLPAVVDQAKDAINAAGSLPEKAVDPAAAAARDALPPELAPVADTAAALTKTLANVADGKIIADAVGAAFDKFGGVMADIVGSGKELNDRLGRLEKENTEKMIELEHSKSNVAALERKLVETTAAFTELIEAHNKRLAELESKVAKLEAERGIFKAPFKVVDAKGATLFSVAADGRTVVGNEGQAMIVMKATGGGSAVLQLSAGDKKLLLATDGGSGTTLQLNDGADAVVKLSADQGQKALLRLAGGGAIATLNADPDNAARLDLQAGSEAGIVVSSKKDDLGMLAQLGGQNALSLGAMPGKGVALRLFDTSGNQVVTAAPNPAQSGAGVVAVGNGGPKSAVIVEAHSDGSGLVHAYSDDGVGGAALAGGERSVVAYNKAGNPVASVGQSDKSEGGTLVARNPEGDGIFAAGFAAEYGGGEACVWRAKRSNTFCLGLGMPGMGVGK